MRTAAMDALRHLAPGVAGVGFLTDAGEVWVRPAQASDRDLLLEFLGRERPEALEQRYSGAVRPEVAAEEILLRSAAEDRLSLIALADEGEAVAVLGVGEYARRPAVTAVAEVAFLVAARARGRGIATLLLHRLARAARRYGITHFEATTGLENREMLNVLRHAGYPWVERTEGGEVTLRLSISEYRETFPPWRGRSRLRLGNGAAARSAGPRGVVQRPA